LVILRKESLLVDDLEAARALLANPDNGVTQIADRLSVSPATLYRYIPAPRTANTIWEDACKRPDADGRSAP
jgi:predicted transcriptional regulator YheO